MSAGVTKSLKEISQTERALPCPDARCTYAAVQLLLTFHKTCQKGIIDLVIMFFCAVAGMSMFFFLGGVAK